MRNVEDLLKLNYRISLRRDEGGDYFATVDELPGCMADGRTPNKAVENVREAMKSWMESRAAAGLEIPEPRDAGDYSGRILVRMPRSLHRKLSAAAARDGVSLNQHIVSTLSESCGRATAIESQQIAAPTGVFYNPVLHNALWSGAAGFRAYCTPPYQVEGGTRYIYYGIGGASLALQDTKVGYADEQNRLPPPQRGTPAAAEFGF